MNKLSIDTILLKCCGDVKKKYSWIKTVIKYCQNLFPSAGVKYRFYRMGATSLFFQIRGDISTEMALVSTVV